MREYQRKRNIQRFLYSPLMLCVLLGLVIFMGKAAWGVYQKERDSRASRVRAEEQLAALEARKSALLQNIGRLKTPEGIEAEIREQFQVAKPGERMVVIVEDKKVPQEEAPKQSFVSKFFDFFR